MACSVEVSLAGFNFKLQLVHFFLIASLLGLFCECESEGAWLSSLDVSVVAVNYFQVSHLQDRVRETEWGADYQDLYKRKFLAERNQWIWAFSATLYLISISLFSLNEKILRLYQTSREAEARAAVTKKDD